MKKKSLFAILLTVVLLLLIPFTAMQFTNEVSWSPLDFAIMAVLLLGAGLLCELVIRKVGRIKYRIALCGAVLTVFILIWLELAVGIFGTPFAGHKNTGWIYSLIASCVVFIEVCFRIGSITGALLLSKWLNKRIALK